MFFILNSILFSKSRIVRVQLYCVKCDSEVNVFFVEKIHTNFDEPTRQIFKQKFVLIINFVSAMYYTTKLVFYAIAIVSIQFMSLYDTYPCQYLLNIFYKSWNQLKLDIYFAIKNDCT